MKVLVFAPLSYQETPYDQWLSDVDVELYLLAPRRTRKSYSAFKNFFPFQRYWSNQNVEVTGLELSKEHEFSAVLAKDEWDILRSARIRESAQIEGQSVESATAFRNKLVMKTCLRNAGVAVADFAEFNHAFDALNFTRHSGFPVVVKPVEGVAGANTRVIRDEAELKEYFTTGIPPQMMIESFVRGQLYHIDGLRSGAGIRFAYSSRYINSCLSFQDCEYSGSISLASDDPLNRRLVDFTEDILRAMPIVHGGNVHAFHAEVFVTPDNGLVCCEVACRPGGGRIVEQTNLEFQVNLDREFLRGQLGLPTDVTQEKAYARRRAGRFAHMFIPHKGVGTVKRLPVLGQFAWAKAEKLFVAQDEVLEIEEGRRQNLASCIIEGGSEAEIESRMREWNSWVLQNTEID